MNRKLLITGIFLTTMAFGFQGFAQTLNEAVKSGNKETVTKLIASKVNINEADNEGRTPLMTACSLGNIELAQILLNSGADVNATNKNNVTAMMIAADFAYVDIVNLLMAHGANAKMRDVHSMSAFDHVIEANVEAAKKNAPAGVRVDRDTLIALLGAAQKK